MSARGSLASEVRNGSPQTVPLPHAMRGILFIRAGHAILHSSTPSHVIRTMSKKYLAQVDDC
eukprot:scaffold534_cov428-Prasinococcus_capsulatus_cf.AAC.1